MGHQCPESPQTCRNWQEKVPAGKHLRRGQWAWHEVPVTLGLAEFTQPACVHGARTPKPDSRLGSCPEQFLEMEVTRPILPRRPRAPLGPGTGRPWLRVPGPLGPGTGRPWLRVLSLVGRAAASRPFQCGEGGFSVDLSPLESKQTRSPGVTQPLLRSVPWPPCQQFPGSQGKVAKENLEVSR